MVKYFMGKQLQKVLSSVEKDFVNLCKDYDYAINNTYIETITKQHI